MTQLWKQLSERDREVTEPAALNHRQRKWLFDCLARNCTTAYGRRYHFTQLSTVEDYQARLPIIDYDDIEDLVLEIANGQSDRLFAGKAIAFERTSGSIGSQKLIPYSQQSIADFRRAIVPWLAALVSQYDIRSGKAYWAISPATRQPELTESGMPIGLPDAAYLGDDLIPFFLASSAVPAWLADIPDVNDWQLLTLYYLVCCHDLKLISVWSPTFMLVLIEALDRRRQELETVLMQGAEKHGHHISANSPVFTRLQSYYNNGDLSVLWPELKLVSCWADASSAYYAEKLAAYFPDVPLQAKGLLLTEGVVSVPDSEDQPVLAADSGFYEFMTAEGDIRLAHELAIGDRYEVIMTTAGGLYRYRTKDIVRCDGYSNGLPVLRFTGRQAVSDLVGEKLTEEFVTSCLDAMDGFRMLVPVSGNSPGYMLVVENNKNSAGLIKGIESRLCENPHYAYARKIGQLQSLRILKLAEPLSIYLNSPLHSGTRLGDIKLQSLCLQPAIFDNYMDNVA